MESVGRDSDYVESDGTGDADTQATSGSASPATDTAEPSLESIGTGEECLKGVGSHIQGTSASHVKLDTGPGSSLYRESRVRVRRIRAKIEP